MKIKRKEKIHPSPAIVQTAATSLSQDSLSVLKLLPAAILALVAALSVQDREVLAYLITRSLKTTTTSSINCSPSTSVQESKKLYRNDKQMKSIGSGGGVGSYHKQPVFDCECFDCYTSFWFRWDSSPNREVIHQAIESFEEHLANGEVKTKRSSNRRSRKKEKLPVQKLEKGIQTPNPAVVEIETLQLPVDETSQGFLHSEVSEKEIEVNTTPTETTVDEAEAEAEAAAAAAAAGGHREFTRKVIPDVLGLFNSRLWNLWGPNV